MKKLACMLLATTFWAAAGPAKAQYVVDAVAVAPAYTYSNGWGAYANYGRFGSPAYSWRSAPVVDTYAYVPAPAPIDTLAPASQAYAAVPACRLVRERQYLPDGSMVIRQVRVC